MQDRDIRNIKQLTKKCSHQRIVKVQATIGIHDEQVTVFSILDDMTNHIQKSQDFVLYL